MRKHKPAPAGKRSPDLPLGPRSVAAGLAILAGLLLIFVIVYVAAIQTTYNSGDGDFSRRAWLWSGYLLSLGAIIAIVWGRRRLTSQVGLMGFILAGLAWLSTSARTDLTEANVAGAITLLAFVGGSVLMPRERGVRVALLHRNRRILLQSLGLGVRVALPLALMGGAYLFLTGQSAQRDPLAATWWAVQTAVVGEVAYRFFTLNVCLAILARLPARPVLIGAIYIVAIVPYSLVETAGMWAANPLGAITILILNSLLFGLPAAYLQWRQNLEAAIGFKWVVDAVRIWAGLLL